VASPRPNPLRVSANGWSRSRISTIPCGSRKRNSTFPEWLPSSELGHGPYGRRDDAVANRGCTSTGPHLVSFDPPFDPEFALSSSSASPPFRDGFRPSVGLDPARLRVASRDRHSIEHLRIFPEWAPVPACPGARPTEAGLGAPGPVRANFFGKYADRFIGRFGMGRISGFARVKYARGRARLKAAFALPFQGWVRQACSCVVAKDIETTRRPKNKEARETRGPTRAKPFEGEQRQQAPPLGEYSGRPPGVLRPEPPTCSRPPFLHRGLISSATGPGPPTGLAQSLPPG